MGEILARSLENPFENNNTESYHAETYYENIDSRQNYMNYWIKTIEANGRSRNYSTDKIDKINKIDYHLSVKKELEKEFKLQFE